MIRRIEQLTAIAVDGKKNMVTTEMILTADEPSLTFDGMRGLTLLSHCCMTAHSLYHISKPPISTIQYRTHS